MSEDAIKRGQLSPFNGWGTFGANADAQERRNAVEQRHTEKGALWELSKFWKRIVPNKPFVTPSFHVFVSGEIRLNYFFSDTAH